MWGQPSKAALGETEGALQPSRSSAALQTCHSGRPRLYVGGFPRGCS